MNGWNDLVLDPMVPPALVGLLALVLGAATLWVYLRTSATLPAPRRAVLLVLRLLGLAAVLLLLLQPSRVERLPEDHREKVTLVALDNSRSMRQPDADGRTRFDAARELLWDSGVSPLRGEGAADGVRLLSFAESAAPVGGPLSELSADGATTKIDASVRAMLDSIPAGDGANAIFLLTDGHDFDLVNPAQTALAARARGVPVYVVPYGGDRVVRDVSVHMTSYQPFHYARQAIRVSANVRPLGSPYETLEVTLLREGRVVERRPVVVRDEVSVPVVFEVNEPAAGQFEYEIRVTPLDGEAQVENNSAVTYLNVIDRRITILLVEGSPYWDTTFLQRSLRRNDKVSVDSVIGYAPGKFHVIRTEEGTGAFRLPETAAEWNRYDLVVLGRNVDKVLAASRIGELETWVDRHGGALVFSRADAFSGTDLGGGLQPVEWGKTEVRSAPLVVARGGEGPLRLLADASGAADSLPPLIGGAEAGEAKPLAATLATLRSDDDFPAMIHRRYGSGQVLSIGVDGLWRWAFNARIDGGSTVFDRFWDQTVLWLMGGRDFAPGSAFTLRASTANVQLGEKLYLNLLQREVEGRVPTPLNSLPLIVRRGDEEIARITATARAESDGMRLSADYLPMSTGRHRIEAVLPDGTRAMARFMVYRDDSEDTDVAADRGFLRRLAENSGGRLVEPSEFKDMLHAVRAIPLDDSPRTRLVSAWDRAWVFWVIGMLFAADWWLRRRWGLC